MLIWDYIKSTEGYTLAKEYTILKCFYTKVDNEASLVMLNHYMKRDDYYKVVSVYPPYHLGSYNYKEYTHNMSNILEDKLFAKVFDILLNINMQAYNTSLVNMKQENYVYLYENESRFAQLSFYSPSTTIEQSPYFNHIQNLFLKSSSFVFMQTSIYSSALVNEMLMASYLKKKAKIKQDIEEYKRYIVLKYKKLVASMRYMYYTVRVKCYPSDLSNSKYDKILLQYVKRSLRNLYDVDMDDIKVEYGRNPHFHYVIKIHGEVAYEYLDHANNHRNFIESYKTFISWYREQSISSSSSSNNNGTNGEPSLKRKITSGVGNIGLSFIAETAIDYMLPIIVKDEYDRNNSVIEFAYTNSRMDNFGCIWNEDKTKNFFTIPKDISQNFIMSDFRAMVVGGAHFDNSCFIKGTSSGRRCTF